MLSRGYSCAVIGDKLIVVEGGVRVNVMLKPTSKSKVMSENM